MRFITLDGAESEVRDKKKFVGKAISDWGNIFEKTPLAIVRRTLFPLLNGTYAHGVVLRPFSKPYRFTMLYHSTDPDNLTEAV